MMMIIERNKPQILSMLFRVLFSYPKGGLEQFWTSFPPLCRSLFLINNGFLHVNIQTGGVVLQGCDCQNPTAKD